MCQASKKGSCFTHFHNTPAQPSPPFLITTSGEHTVSLHKHAKTNYHQFMHLPQGRWQWQSISQTPTHKFTISLCIYHRDGGSGNRFHKRRPTSVSINSKTKGSWLNVPLLYSLVGYPTNEKALGVFSAWIVRDGCGLNL
jgi:hypothetical protein